MISLKNRIYLLSFIFLGISFSQTYNVFGVVLDDKTKEPIDNVNIYIKKYDIGTISDKEGYFSLFLDKHVKRNLQLHIQIIGYEEEYYNLIFQ